MDTFQQANTPVASTSAREIPTPPGGGSWTFDEESWEWISNDPVPEPPADAGEDVANKNIEQE
ncbi:hypothetical protein [Massilia sp. Root1485]|uniref:hypothetical protein n=1 Tax=Massilia sp. Root1485 TaxID=1736472 RepID=UPI0006FB926C|nr:hypothetical protein [Massilia sp. Root1485]KQZ34297.1 hypothetical protein ASD92_08260 [Massilia sp. Root1485]